MKFEQFLIESSNPVSQQRQQAIKNAKKFRTLIDKQNQKHEKEQTREQSRVEKEKKKQIKNNIKDIIKNAKQDSKEKTSFVLTIEKLKTSVKPETYQLISYLAQASDKLKTKKQDGTTLITKNTGLVPKILSSPIVANHRNPKISKLVADILKISNDSINPRIKGDIIKDFRMINNQLYNIYKKMIVELIRCDMEEVNGVSQ